MVRLSDYANREQAYVKHLFLEQYLEALIFKVAAKYDEIAYVDGFAGPWQNADENYSDTSFGIALEALQKVKTALAGRNRIVTMRAYLVERDRSAFDRLTTICDRFPEIAIELFNADFMESTSAILGQIPRSAFAFFLIDPKGWRINLKALEPLLSRDNSEVVFNFMFDFINRAASMTAIAGALNELILYGNWRARLTDPDADRKAILTAAFSENLAHLGGFNFVAETTVLRPLKDRPLYSLYYCTRHKKGLEVFRECQIKALREQSKLRAAIKLEHAANRSGQSELFESLNDMNSNEIEFSLKQESQNATEMLLSLVPAYPKFATYGELWPLILARNIIRKSELNQIVGTLRTSGALISPDWGSRKRVPGDLYRLQRTVL